MIGPIKPFNSIGGHEAREVNRAIMAPLSGYLAGKETGGEIVCELEDAWCEMFKIEHAIACNSATSGLLAASFAVGLKPGDHFAVPAMTMSATAAAPMFTGAEPIFIDVSDEDFAISDNDLPYDCPVFATNLFGHPARLQSLRRWCDLNKEYLIEDNSQSPFAWDGDKLAGTIGHIGVFSLNVHKPLQCGEGGVIVTDDDEMAAKMRAFINHGEHVGPHIGLNLRMPEVCAAIALCQLQRGPSIIHGRIDQATAILAAIGDIPGLRLPIVRKDCRHVYYTIPFMFEMRVGTGDSNVNVYHVESERRVKFCAALRAEGVPIVEGYVPPLYRMPAFARFARPCPVAEDLHDRRLFYFENCAYDVTLAQAEEIGDAFRKAAEMVL